MLDAFPCECPERKGHPLDAIEHYRTTTYSAHDEVGATLSRSRMDSPQEAIVGRVLFRIVVDAEAASHVRSRELHVLEGVLGLALERIRTELEARECFEAGGAKRHQRS